jgi:hypothetical protein
MEMDDNCRLQLQKMIKINNVEDQTNLIRKLKHSSILENDINNLILIMAKYRNDPDKINEEGMSECGFLFNYYTDIYNKIRKNEIDLSMLNNFLNVLREIEDGELDQHEGAFKVGTILKNIYIDSALKKGENLDKKYNSENNTEPKVTPINISWHQYKQQQHSHQQKKH